MSGCFHMLGAHTKTYNIIFTSFYLISIQAKSTQLEGREQQSLKICSNQRWTFTFSYLKKEKTDAEASLAAAAI